MSALLYSYTRLVDLHTHLKNMHCQRKSFEGGVHQSTSFLKKTTGNFYTLNQNGGMQCNQKVFTLTTGVHPSSYSSDTQFIFISITTNLIKTQISHNFYFTMKGQKIKSILLIMMSFFQYILEGKKFCCIFCLIVSQRVCLCRSQFCKQ